MKAKANLTILLAVGWGVIIWMQHYPIKPASKGRPATAITLPPRRELVTSWPPGVSPTPRPEAESPTHSPAAESERQSVPVTPKTEQTPVASATEAPTAPLSEVEVKAAVGRLALGMVGADSAAEQVWLMAINDSSLPEEVRQNLIEDLNEDGLSDPKNPTLADLPLIENRLTLIAALGPVAMDDVNAAAFREAYKDLAEMHQKLTQR